MNIIELAQLRAELSNPAIGSKDHLRKLSLSLLEALEKALQERENWRTSFDNERFRADKLAATLSDKIEQAANVRGQLLIAHKTLLNQQAKIAELEEAMGG